MAIIRHNLAFINLHFKSYITQKKIGRVNRRLVTPAFSEQQVGEKSILGVWDPHMKNLMLIKNTSLFFVLVDSGWCRKQLKFPILYFFSSAAVNS